MANTRWRVRRSIDSANHQMDTAQEILCRSASLYEANYPEIWAQFCEVVTQIEGMKRSINKLKDLI